MFPPSLSATTFRSRREKFLSRPLITITGKQRIGLGSTVSNLTRLRKTAAGRNRRHFSNCCLFSGLQSLSSLLSSSFSLILFWSAFFCRRVGSRMRRGKMRHPLSYIYNPRQSPRACSNMANNGRHVIIITAAPRFAHQNTRQAQKLQTREEKVVCVSADSAVTIYLLL